MTEELQMNDSTVPVTKPEVRPKHPLRRVRGFGIKKYKTKDVDRLIEVNEILKLFTFRLSQTRNETKFKNVQNVVYGDNNQVVVTEELRAETESLLEDICEKEAKLVLEVEELKNVLLSVQNNVETVSETSCSTKNIVESVKEMLNVHLDDDQRTARMVDGIDALKHWIKHYSPQELQNITFSQVPQKAKTAIQYLSRKYGDRTDAMIKVFQVLRNISTPNTDDFCARLLALWIKQNSKRNFRDLRRVLGNINRLSIKAEVSKFSSLRSSSGFSTGSENENTYDSLSSYSRRSVAVTLDKVLKVVTDTKFEVQKIANGQPHQNNTNSDAFNATQEISDTIDGRANPMMHQNLDDADETCVKYPYSSIDNLCVVPQDKGLSNETITVHQNFANSDTTLTKHENMSILDETNSKHQYMNTSDMTHGEHQLMIKTYKIHAVPQNKRKSAVTFAMDQNVRESRANHESHANHELQDDVGKSHSNHEELKRRVGRSHEKCEVQHGVVESHANRELQHGVGKYHANREDLQRGVGKSHENRGELQRSVGKSHASHEVQHCVSKSHANVDVQHVVVKSYANREDLQCDVGKSHANREEFQRGGGKSHAKREEFRHGLSKCHANCEVQNSASKYHAVRGEHISVGKSNDTSAVHCIAEISEATRLIQQGMDTCVATREEHENIKIIRAVCNRMYKSEPNLAKNQNMKTYLHQGCELQHAIGKSHANLNVQHGVDKYHANRELQHGVGKYHKTMRYNFV